MKIFHLPAHLLDNTTLIYQRELLEYAIDKIADPEYQNPSDRIVERYQNYNGYLIFLLGTVYDELDERKLDSGDITNLVSRVGNNTDFPIDMKDISRDIDFIYSIWEEYIGFDDEIPEFIETLGYLSLDDIMGEIQYNLQKFKEEYA